MTMDQSSDIDAWRRVHRHLTLALVQSRDNISAELAKRRYLLEEMNRLKMQSTQKSAPSNLKGKKRVAPKIALPPEVATIPQPTAAGAVVAPSASAGVVIGGAGSSPDDKKEDSSKLDAGGAEDSHPTHYDGITPQQMSQLYHPYDMGVATPQQMDLAFQMMQQIKNASNEGGDDSDIEEETE